MRAQHFAALQVEGVHHRAGWVVGGNVQRAEIIPVVFDVRAVLDGKTHGAENRRDLLGGAADRVDRPGNFGADGGGDVDPFRRQPALQRRRIQHRAAFRQRLGDDSFENIQLCASGFARVRVHRAQRFQFGGDRAVLAEQRDAQFL